MLGLGLVPVLHGDCVMDDEMGGCVLSGDTIIQTMCEEFTVRRVVFLTDVSGVYDRPPQEPGAALLRHIAVQQDGTIKVEVSTSSSQHDVTGGIALKLQSAVNIVCKSHGVAGNSELHNQSQSEATTRDCRVIICHVKDQNLVNVCKGDITSDLNLTVIAMNTLQET